MHNTHAGTHTRTHARTRHVHNTHAGTRTRTHATRAGSPPSRTGFQGLAPGAVLAFQDLGLGAASGIDVPSDLNADYFPFSYQ